MNAPRRTRATVLLYCSGKVALIHRRRGRRSERRDWWVVPGGGIEAGESARAAAERETAEELGLDVHAGDELCHMIDEHGREHVLFVARLDGRPPKLRLGGAERDAHCASNRYEPRWVRLDRVPCTLHGALSPELVRLIGAGVNEQLTRSPARPLR